MRIKTLVKTGDHMNNEKQSAWKKNKELHECIKEIGWYAFRNFSGPATSEVIEYCHKVSEALYRHKREKAYFDSVINGLNRSVGKEHAKDMADIMASIEKDMDDKEVQNTENEIILTLLTKKQERTIQRQAEEVAFHKEAARLEKNKRIKMQRNFEDGIYKGVKISEVHKKMKASDRELNILRSTLDKAQTISCKKLADQLLKASLSLRGKNVMITPVLPLRPLALGREYPGAVCNDDPIESLRVSDEIKIELFNEGVETIGSLGAMIIDELDLILGKEKSIKVIEALSFV